MEIRKTEFLPVQHGFRFVNRFEFPEILGSKLSLVGPLTRSLKDVIYGLCGGMSFAAIDYFKLGRPVPDYDDPDEINVKLFHYLWNRQLDSLRGPTLRKLLTAMLRSDTGLAKVVRNEEVPKLRAAIDSGTPAVLALVRVKGLNDPTRNHQVLATGYELDPETQQMTVQLYDPNHPHKEPSLTFSLSATPPEIMFSQSTGEKLRGFFVIDYWPETPPA
jgi:hypothetical protein